VRALEFGLVSKSSRACIRALTVCAYDMRVAVMRQLPSLLLKLSQIHSTTSMAIPLMEFLSSQLSCFRVSYAPDSNNSSSNKLNSVYGAVIVAVHCHCESSPGSSDECSTQRQLPIGSYSDYIHHRHLLLLSPKADNLVTFWQQLLPFLDRFLFSYCSTQRRSIFSN